VAIFGRKTARQRLRRATSQSLEIPAFSSPVDCTPWVIGGLWPVELTTLDDENTALAEYLEADLQRITSAANDELGLLKRAGMADAARKAAEARIIAAARARAVRRVESTMRRLRGAEPPPPQLSRQYLRPPAAQDRADRDLHETQVIPAITLDEPVEDAVTHAIPRADLGDMPGERPARDRAPAPHENETTTELRPIRAAEPVRTPKPVAAERPRQTAQPVARPESDSDRLQRLLTFVARQEPRLSWGVGDRPDGTTLLVTDVAHGWIPAGIAVPAGVRLLAPERRTGKVAALLGETTRAATYSPGDPLSRTAEPAPTESSAQPRDLPDVDDLGWELSQATHWRDGLPRIVHTLARAAGAGTGVVDEELELLRVHLDTARYQVLGQYPDVDPALLLNFLLLSATEGSVTGDSTSANYHLAWFLKLNAPPAGQWAEKP
jgi:Family of unknown function (DUF5631)/Family of unknown function (DUF5632)